MKTIICLFLISFGLTVHAAPPFQNVTWGLTWDQPTNMPILSAYSPATNQAYKVYVTTTVGTPQAAWSFATIFTNWTLITNGGSISLSNNVTLPFAPQYFFAVNPTNVWGEPPFSLGYWSATMSGPAWSTVQNSGLNRQGP